MSDFHDLKPGDKVFVQHHSYDRSNKIKVATVERVTKTLIVTASGGRYRRSDGWEPGTGWHRGWLVKELSPAQREAYREQLRVSAARKLADKLKDASMEQLDAIRKILDR